MGIRNRAVLPFERSGAFYHRRAVLKADRQSYLEAVGFLRKALEHEPNNSEYLLDLADVFARMSCYDESNRVLVSIVRMGEATAECFFGMGCNFYALKQYERAREAFSTYKELEPEGEYADAVEDLIEELNEIFEQAPLAHISTIAQRGAQALDSGDYQQAIKFLERAVKREPEAVFIRNNLALALFLAGNAQRAARETAEVLAADESNLHANCNMAIFLTESGRRAQAAVHLARAMETEPEEPEDLGKLCLTLCEVGRDADAHKYLKKLLLLRPYDKGTLHRYAVACYNLGEYQNAIAAWDRVRRIDPYSPMPPFCIAKARAAIEGEKARRMSYLDQLPAEEVRRRVAEFAGNLGANREEFSKRFEDDAAFRELVRWGLGVSDATFRRTALKLLTFMGGPMAEEMLREFLMRPDEGEEIKREVMSCLKDIGAKEPFVAVLGGQVVEVRISVFSSERSLTDAQRQVVQMAIEGLPFDEETPRDERENMIGDMIALWTDFLNAQSARGHRIRKPQNWAAALLNVFYGRMQMKMDVHALCRRFAVTPRIVSTYSGYLREGLQTE